MGCGLCYMLWLTTVTGRRYAAHMHPADTTTDEYTATLGTNGLHIDHAVTTHRGVDLVHIEHRPSQRLASQGHPCSTVALADETLDQFGWARATGAEWSVVLDPNDDGDDGTWQVDVVPVRPVQQVPTLAAVNAARDRVRAYLDALTVNPSIGDDYRVDTLRFHGGRTVTVTVGDLRAITSDSVR